MNILFVELYRNFFLAVRYPFAFFVQIIMSISLFYLLLMGGNYFANSGEVANKKVEVLLVNYFFWILAVTTIASIPQQIEEDAKAGTLEQVLQSVYPASLLFFIRGLTGAMLQFIISLVTLAILILATGVVPQVNWYILLSIVPVILCGLGIGLLLGGVGIWVKRTAIIIAALQLPLLFLLAYPFETHFSTSVYEWWLFLPFVADSFQLRFLVQTGTYRPDLYFYAAFSSVIWLMVGFVAFMLMLKYTKKGANTGGY